MSTFGEELRKIREREELTLKAMAEQLGIAMASYNNVERGASSAQSPTAKRIIASNRLTAADKQRLNELSKIKVEKKTIKVTDADRLAYQRRKNEKYKREMQK